MPKNYETRRGPGGGAQMYVNGQWLDENLFSDGTGLRGPLSPQQEANAGYAPGSMQDSHDPYLGQQPDAGSNLYEPWRTPVNQPATSRPPTPKIAAKPKTKQSTAGQTGRAQNTGSPIYAAGAMPSERQKDDVFTPTGQSTRAQAATTSRYSGIAAEYNKKTSSKAAADKNRPLQSQSVRDQRAGEYNPAVPQRGNSPAIPTGQGLSGSPMDLGGPNNQGGRVVQTTTSKAPTAVDQRGLALSNVDGWVKNDMGVWQKGDVNKLIPPKQERAKDDAAYPNGGGPVPASKNPRVKAVTDSYNGAEAALADAARWTGDSIFNYNKYPDTVTEALIEEIYPRNLFDSAQEFLIVAGFLPDPEQPGLWVNGLKDKAPLVSGGGSGGGYSRYNRAPGLTGGWGYDNHYGGGGHPRGGFGQGGGGRGGSPYGSPLIKWNIRA